MRTGFLLTCLCLGLAALLVAVQPGQAEEKNVGRTMVVTIKDMRFLVNGLEQPLTIRPGDLIVWVNADPMTHRVASSDGGRTFDTGDIPAGGQSAPVALAQEMVVEYLCPPHPWMRGKIVVRAAP